MSILRTAGLVAPASVPASGFCVILLEDGYHWEQVLRHEPGSLEPVDNYSIEESARQAVQLVDRARNEPTEQDIRFVYYACHQIAVKTGWRYFRAQQRGDTVTVVKVDADDLRRDLADGSIAKLSIAGVNAPLPA